MSGNSKRGETIIHTYTHTHTRIHTHVNIGRSLGASITKTQRCPETIQCNQKARSNTEVRGLELLLDNAPAYTSKLVQDYLLENIGTLPHSLCLPDFARATFFCSLTDRNALLVAVFAPGLPSYQRFCSI